MDYRQLVYRSNCCDLQNNVEQHCISIRDNAANYGSADLDLPASCIILKNKLIWKRFS